jgi:hypothetical protein
VKTTKDTDMDLTSYDKAVRDSAERFAKDTGPYEHDEYLPYGHLGPKRRVTDRPHEMRILHDDGLYRHLRFKSPDHGSYWFELITAPGSLTFRGDGESFVFARERDMFGFFRSSRDGSINPGYWSEKLTSARDAAFKYDEESFRTQVWECVRTYRGIYRGLAKAVQAHFFDGWASEYDISFEDQARAALEAFSYTPNNWTQPFTFTDTWEWDFKGFDWWFLWACHAIVWGIARYDEAKAATGAEAVTV